MLCPGNIPRLIVALTIFLQTGVVLVQDAGTAGTSGKGAGMTAGHFVIGAVLVAGGAMASLWLPFGLVGGLALLALMRICWLEDNINSDLFGRDSLPPGYRNTAQFRRLVVYRWFGIRWDESMAEQSAHLMATAMRAEVQIWGATLLGLAATLVAQQGPFGGLLNLGLGGVLFVMALRRADRLALSLWYCDAGRALPDHLLVPNRRRLLAERDR
jgi:hypothetical protein